MNILPEVLALENEMIENRRWFHAHPELSFQEFQTAKKVVEILKGFGIDEIYEEIGRTGVVAIIRGGNPGMCLALRADMDALPLPETADVPYKSQNVNVMHACGHDGHMSGLLGAAKVLFNERQSLFGVIKLIFQPAEEGYGGAREMIKDGCLENGPCGPRVDCIYGLHLWSGDPVGTIGCQGGPVMAASDVFEVNVYGKGGHGAMPQDTVDAIVESAALITSFQTVISRNKSPLETGVITCGTINGGYKSNIIADHVVITGTCRTFTEATKERIRTRMGEICCGIAATYGGRIEFDYIDGYPATVNAYPDCVEAVHNAASKIVGVENARKPQKTMGAEDFSYFLLQRPGCFFFVGAALPGENRPHHKSVFDFDEKSLLISASTFVQLARDLMLSP